MAQYREEILTIFGSYFGRNDYFINSFWNLQTFNGFESFLVLPPDSLKNTKEAIYFVDNPTKDLLPPIPWKFRKKLVATCGILNSRLWIKPTYSNARKILNRFIIRRGYYANQLQIMFSKSCDYVALFLIFFYRVPAAQ